MVYICGDFNAKLGRKLNDNETFMGYYGRNNDRNENGEHMIDFLMYNNLYVTNTMFRI